MLIVVEVLRPNFGPDPLRRLGQVSGCVVGGLGLGTKTYHCALSLANRAKAFKSCAYPFVFFTFSPVDCIVPNTVELWPDDPGSSWSPFARGGARMIRVESGQI